MRAKLLWGMLLVILAVVNFAVWQKEQVLEQGRTVLLELAPRDPRSLLQGDYMMLNYRLGQNIRANIQTPSMDGLAVVRVDAHGQGVFDHVRQRGEALQPDQVPVRFRKRGQSVRIGAEAFFFQEGNSAVYAPARYGELKVARNGEAVLVGLRDAAGQPLLPPRHDVH